MNLSFQGLCKSYKGKTVFKNITGKIEGQDKIGLIGVNGIGKTTLARILSGEEICDQGEIQWVPSNTTILYIEQYPEFDSNVSVYEEIYRVAASGNHHHIIDIETIVKMSLNKVGLDEKMWGLRALSLSGGEKTKLALCKAMVSSYDLLILDEPTNHLDLKSYEWLEEFIRSINKPMLIISHDRFFLDNVVSKIWELTSQRLSVYEGNYSAYKMQKENELTTITREYEKQQMEIRHLKKVINERKNWYEGAHKAAGTNDFYRAKAKKHANVLKAKKKQLERIEKTKISKPEKNVSPGFQMINKNTTGTRLPRFLVQGKNVSKSFGKKVILQNTSFNIRRGDKIALIGENGVGKTTLLKMICGIESYSGTIRINPSVKIGYFAQELDNLNNDSSVLDDVLNVGTTVEDTMSILAALLFRGEGVHQKIASLSMGEKGRVAFAKLILSGADLLILDEPTNYMDIPSKEKIEHVLDEFMGSIIFVSHDRYLIQRLANSVFVIDKQNLYCYYGDYEYYIAKCREQMRREEVGVEYKDLADNIRRLECELAFLGGKLNEVLDEEEKEMLSKKYLAAAKELNKQKKVLKKLK
ncbi:MAG TPA: ABC-F type ribosomal protection protein [Syntrophaceticus sp.]|jgi:ATP-binding cassette subfamily F protein 3|nr:ABC-F type ribosomal protection protein [Syntrophaceticus sp.]